jgi:hypothetical protein
MLTIKLAALLRTRFSIGLAILQACIALSQDQGQDAPLGLSITPASSETPASIVRVRLQNNSGRRIPIRIGDPEDTYRIELYSTTTQREPERTAFGLQLREGRRLFCCISDRGESWLEPGQIVEQSVDLRNIWVLRGGQHKVVMSRVFELDGGRIALTANATFDLPSYECVPKIRTIDAHSGIVPVRPPILESVLTRRIQVRPDNASESLVTAFHRMIRGSSGTGGVALWGNDAIPFGTVCVTDGRRVSDVLEDMHDVIPSLKQDPDASTVNLIDQRITAFLETRISKIPIPDPRLNTAEAVNTLLAAPEIVESMQRFNLTNTGSNQSSVPQGQPVVTLQATTLREALNTIVQRHRNGIWVYREYSAAEPGRRVFSLTFSVGTP